MKKTIIVLLLAALAAFGLIHLATGFANAATTHVSCTRNLPVTGNNDSVVMYARQTCGFGYRAVGFWAGGPADGYHYGVYRTTNGKYSVACADTNCDIGIVQWGGYQVERTGKIVCAWHCGTAPAWAWKE